MKKIKEWALIVLFNIVFIAAILYGVEFLFSPYRGLPKDGVYGEERYTWGHLVEKNRYGYREREFETPKPPGVYRVMVLGDSFTWGQGLAVEERYTAVAEELLNHSSTGVKFEVLNFGVPGASTTMERSILRKYIDEVQPDLVVVGFTLNDTQPKEQNYSFEREMLDEKGGQIVRELSHKMYYMGLPFIGTSLRQAFYTSFERSGKIPGWETALQRTYDKSSEEWGEFVNALEGIKWITDHRNLAPPIFAVLNQGTSTQQPTDYGNPDEALELYLQWYHQAEQAAAEAGFVVYNHEQEIAAQLNDEALAINRIDNHPSANLNRLYGGKLFEIIQGLLEEDR